MTLQKGPAPRQPATGCCRNNRAQARAKPPAAIRCPPPPLASRGQRHLPFPALDASPAFSNPASTAAHPSRPTKRAETTGAFAAEAGEARPPRLMQPTMLAARSLRKASVPPTLLSDPSPGSLPPTRLAVHLNGDGSACSAYLASGCRVYKIEISMNGEMLSKGKESLLIPDNAQVLSSSVVDRCPHRAEIQSVALAEGEGDNSLILGTVDSYGQLIVSRLDSVDDDIDRASYSVPPRDYGIGEGSWAGLCFSPMHRSMVAVARQLCKSVDVYDQDIHLRSLRTLWYPSSFSFLPCSPQVNECSSLLAIAEGSQLSIWDLRLNNNGGCVQRISGSIGNVIYSVCNSPSRLIATGGTDRTVTIYDPRRWTALSRWVGCSKYEITGLSFSSIDQSFIYVQGADYEITCGLWKENERAFSFRGDSNLLGFSKCAETDVVAGWCESGNIFIADVRQM